MAKVGDLELSIAHVYSTAMLDIAESLGESDTLLGELNDLASLVDQDRKFAAFVSNPTIDVAIREKSFEKLFRGRYSDLLVDSLQVINRKGRLGLLSAVVESYQKELNECKGKVEVRVVTAVPLPPSAKTKIREWAARRTGKEPYIVQETKASLLGGLIVHLGGRKFDMSLSARLNRLGATLIERVSREIYSGKSYVEN